MNNNELYNIYDFCSFRLLNETKYDILNIPFNPEYKFFQNQNILENHFDLTISNYRGINSLSPPFSEYKQGNASWVIKNKGDDGYHLYVKNKGLRSLFKFLSFKNLYVRSLFSLYLLKKKAILLHASSFSLNNAGLVLTGRPGVFKTSILMDAVRDYKARFLGEENVILYDGKLYPFPLNIDSIEYKINNFQNEDPKNKFEKLKLGLHIFMNSWLNKSNFTLAEITPVKTILYVQKGNKLKLDFVEYQEIEYLLIQNEIEELSIPPTHTLSGITRNYFIEIISENELRSFKEDILDELRQLNPTIKFGILTVPQKYSQSITKKIIEECFYES